MSNNSLENQKSIQIRQNLKTENVLHILDAEINQILSEVKFPRLDHMGYIRSYCYSNLASFSPD